MYERLIWNLDKRIVGKNMWYSTSILPASLNDEDVKKISRNEDHYFLQFNFSRDQLKERQGFKIHISATINNYEKILDIIYNFCKENKVTFKYISNISELEKNLSGLSSLWSAGKFITIYPQQENFKLIINKLYSLHQLKKFKGIYLLTDRRYKDSDVIFYRYGVINDSSNKGIFDANGKYLYTDYMVPKYRLPSFIREPFPNNKDDKSPHSKYLFSKYHPIQNIYRKSSGSVYCVKNSEDGNKYVLKNARPNFSNGSITQIERLKNEKKKLKKLAKFNFFPQIIESFTENENYFLVETLVNGMTVNQFRAKDLADYTESEHILPKSFAILEIIKDMCRKLRLLHKEDIFLGDLSANNILIDEKNRIVQFVDVEQTEFNISEKQIDSFFRTPGFFDERTNTLTPLQQDIQQLGYVITSIFCRANSFLEVDPSGKTTISFFKEFARIYHVPKTLVDIPLLLIEKPYESSLKSVLDMKMESNIENKINNINVFPVKLLHELKNSYFCNRLDTICSENKEQISFCNKEQVLYTAKIADLGQMCLENKKNISILTNNKKAINLARKEIAAQFSDELSPELRMVNISTFLSIINCSLFVDNFSLKDKKDEREIEIILDYLLKNYKVVENKFIGFRKSVGSKYVIPYLSNGAAGVLTSLLFYKKATGKYKYDTIIQNIAYGFKSIVLPKSGSFSDGLAGIIYALLLYREITEDSKIDTLIKKMIHELHMYTIDLSNNLYVISADFKHVNLSFMDGNLGMIKVLEKARQIINWEAEVN